MGVSLKTLPFRVIGGCVLLITTTITISVMSTTTVVRTITIPTILVGLPRFYKFFFKRNRLQAVAILTNQTFCKRRDTSRQETAKQTCDISARTLLAWQKDLCLILFHVSILRSLVALNTTTVRRVNLLFLRSNSE